MRTLKRYSFAVLLLLAAGCSTGQDRFSEAYDALQRGDYATAYRGFRLLAEEGNAVSQHNLGYMYANGRGVPRDYAEAARWYRRAAEQGLAPAQLMLGFFYGMGRGVPRNLVQAYKWFSLAAFRLTDSDKRERDLAVEGRGRVAKTLTAAQLARAQRLVRRWRPKEETARRRRSPRKAGTGSGFRVSAHGHILTNAHVIDGCAEVRVTSLAHGFSGRVEVAARDDGADLALLEGSAGAPFATFRRRRGVRPGARVVVAGFPLHGMLAQGVNVTVGNVAALAGPGNDRRLIQITAPVQPGNSGGPVLDSDGNVAGAVVSQLDALKVARATGSLPQNVNFAVSAATVRAFLDAEGIAYRTARRWRWPWPASPRPTAPTTRS